ncbi:hypothetical protein [Nocardioides solisilvae]|uniref:hypothetical protein n=1 Tax=Nocardioides solisilvae TaxID=1542435 RepID=UPI000D744145|nr:hypothetical protein [Nocardioides solisilvae]
MTHADDFDDLYKAVRDPLLAEAYALTGDLHVSRTAVRDALAVAWHHWHKVRHRRDQVGWLRPLVWSRARHRHTARPWHKEKDVPAGVAATLDALAGLSGNQRKALVLTHLPALPTPGIAREVGVPETTARELVRAGTAALAAAREVPEAEVGALFEELRATTAGGRWPRSTILRRAGTARRRTHTLLGVVGTAAAVVLSGMVVAQGETVDASLGEQGFERRATQVEPEEVVPTLSEDSLLQATQARRLGRGLEWAEADTHDNAGGDGLVLPCQATRYADPEGLGTLVRFFEGSTRPETAPSGGRGDGDGGKQRRARRAAPPEVRADAIQLTELSASPEAAATAFRTVQDWVADCTAPRLQLLAAHELRGVGDEARLYTLRSWQGPTRTVHLGVARSGQHVTVTSSRVPGLRPAPKPAGQLLAAAVNASCGTPGAGSCATPPRPRPVAVPVAEAAPGMLTELDLPPVAGAIGPWVGTAPKPARTNTAQTRCDRTTFQAKGLRDSRTRTFLFLQGKRADEFGLTQSAAVARTPKVGRGFVEQVRSRLAQCAQEGFGTEVSRLFHRTEKKVDLSVWRLELALPDESSLEFLMAIMRHGDKVAQATFTPTQGRTMGRDDFVWLSRRAVERLPRFAP